MAGWRIGGWLGDERRVRSDPVDARQRHGCLQLCIENAAYLRAAG